ncbi:uncharacterized protein TNCV_2632081 [Trichonephila clavipes]|nr:uncharacterized protein TNCV_2632081 [Trichonephila clavipes]
MGSRVVLQGHEGGHSLLNKNLHKGPNCHPHILELLLRFRKNPVVFTADVKSAFPRIKLDFSDQDFTRFFRTDNWGCGNPVVKVSDHGRYVMSSSPVPLKTHRVGQRYTLNLSRAETSSRWCAVVVRRGECQLRCRPRHLTMVQNDVVGRQKPSCS